MGFLQVSAGPHTFTYDHVFGGGNGADPTTLYDECVQPLVEGLFSGYNATVFAYGVPPLISAPLLHRMR